jgi:hypothetical protein
MEILKVGLVEGITDNFNVEIVKVVSGQAVSEVWCCDISSARITEIQVV